ncbi:hypothetical protein WL05_22585 [Burkholderia ubonensis]|nr:hypothetical protein WJ51_28965 [Burkholderia ubonensis]KVM21472.1 hypothetical protein WJ52_04315 [Burkholderia ubonensis]KVM54851.1 hypothetical protein WJ56_06045 [Burkholderia ubonensis]KVN86226.1 hypothetical protein WJ69_17975 [Burkholderia ubonensis]KVN94584.1 hypothetical protein WJ71_32425 [Burkholderia ubonensis]
MLIDRRARGAVRPRTTVPAGACRARAAAWRAWTTPGASAGSAPAVPFEFVVESPRPGRT